MADKKNTTEKKIKGSAANDAADKITSLAPATREAPPVAKSVIKGKLLAKNKRRLPRRQKKAQQKGR